MDLSEIIPEHFTEISISPRVRENLPLYYLYTPFIFHPKLHLCLKRIRFDKAMKVA